MQFIENLRMRLTYGWSLTRVVYIFLGGFIVVQSVWSQDYVFAFFGSYFALMGLFGFGCAGGNCYR